ncbi:site-specific DNA-methyltransferase [Corynebacterium sp. AOP36-E1-14]|uniref:site-specific DNA-methyltransferase n=1 Tax=unclassified Corynebacterium TaxID=2624378 RepID=UPI004033F963
MSKLTDLINQARKTDPRLGEALAEELRDLANRRTFGLVFEQHQPENVELPGVHPRRGDKVHILPPRGENSPTDPTLWQVLKTRHSASPKTVLLEKLRPADDTDRASTERREVPIDDVIVVAETGDTIYPGLIQTGEVHNGPDDAPAHVVINAENSHALLMLTYTHTHSIDAIYIDPPYNSGAKDWKYNNDYVGAEDDYRHSKWLSFMKRRLNMAKQLLNPEDSVLIVTIDEKEVHRLGVLLEQTFTEAHITTVTSVINNRAVARKNDFSRTAEYIFVVMIGSCAPNPLPLGKEWNTRGEEAKTVRGKIHWQSLRRLGLTGAVAREDRPNMFYPIYVYNDGSGVHSIGQPIALEDDPSYDAPEGTTAVWPIRANGTDGYWQIGWDRLGALVEKGYVKAPKPQPGSIRYLKRGERGKVESGEYRVIDKEKDGSIKVEATENSVAAIWIPGESWTIPAHDAGSYGSNLVSKLIPSRKFPFPKSLYAVEDVLRFFVAQKKDATVLDFFSGSGTTAHAVMRLNRQDGGRRRSISITNNEVSAEEQKALREKGMRPGDPEWGAMGICDYVTKPRVTAAITGKTPDGTPVKGAYKFTDEFDMADGFAANARFFTLTYESAAMISQRLAFERVAPLLWLRAGQTGRIINDLGDTGWDIADTYAVIENTDDLEDFLDALTVAVDTSEALSTVFVITDDDRQFQATALRLDDLGVDSHRLYASYLTNFEFTNGDAQ